MLTPPRPLAFAIITLTAWMFGCGSSDSPSASGAGGAAPATCSTANQTGCPSGQACEDVAGAQPACFAPLSVEGKVVGALDQKPIGGARVVARDVNDAAVSTVAISKADGTYSLNVPAQRDAKGIPIAASITLRADATGFQTFPKAPRIALPIDLSTAAGTPPVLHTAATDIDLIPLSSTTGLGTVSGHVIADHPGGTLVVAGGATGIADTSGAYAVFNVAAGSAVDVRGYAAGLQITPAKAAVTAGTETKGIDLKSTGAATANVSGKVDIVNGGGASTTSVILAVEETFDATAARGEAPKGLKAENVTGTFTIAGVPDGKYVVLAAFENDGLVRDPDTSIAGTQILHITVAGADMPISSSFKVTGALAVVSPGANGPDSVSGTPTFVWANDSSEDHYELRVFDALGNLNWEDDNVPTVNGSKPISFAYGGPGLKSGMIYQFRATSIGKSGTAISATEDLKGVFSYK